MWNAMANGKRQAIILTSLKFIIHSLEIVDQLVWSTEIKYGAKHQTEATEGSSATEGPEVCHPLTTV
jgi:hypothetical protein